MIKMDVMDNLNERNICRICEHQIGKYSCPRCNVVYCSVNCYKSFKHLECSEIFYKNCIKEEIQLSDTDEGNQKMLEILNRFNEQNSDIEITNNDSDDNESIPDLDERLTNIDLNDVKQVWEHLSSDEQQEFEALVNSGDITKLIPVWKPWWDYKVETKLIEEVDKSSNDNEYKNRCPSIVDNIKPFEQISKLTPALCVKYNLLNIIYSYACVVRYFNGDHFDFVKESVYLLSNLSKNLESNVNFESYSLSLECVYQQILLQQQWLVIDDDFKFKTYKDVENIIKGPSKSNQSFYMKCALSDIYNLLMLAKKSTSIVKENNEFSKRFQDFELPEEKIILKDKLKIYIKKIEYYLSYINSFECKYY